MKDYGQRLKEIASQYQISSIYVFGSRATEIKSLLHDELKVMDIAQSDLDIGVHYSEGYKSSAREKVRLILDLEDLFKVKRVDLIDVSEAGAFLALDIIRGELIYCSDLDNQAQFELYVLRRAGDLAKHEREYRNNILRRI